MINPQFSIKINGVQDPAWDADIVEIVVDTSVYLPAMCTILLRDQQLVPGLPAFSHTDNMLAIRIGADVEIGFSVIDPDGLQRLDKTIFDGEITAIEPVFKADGEVWLRLRGYDRAYRLTQGKHTRSFGDGKRAVSDKDILSKVIRDAGLTPKIDFSVAKNMYDYVMQYNQTDWDFIWQRAKLLGCQVYCDGKDLHFEAAGSNDSPIDLNWQEMLTSFEPRISAMGAATSVTVTGWDVDHKKIIKSKVTSAKSGAEASIGDPIKPSMALKMGLRNSSVEDGFYDPSITSASVTKAYATSLLGKRDSQFVRAKGEATHPKVVAGTKVKIGHVGTRFSGTYFVTEAQHIFREADYKVRFQVSGENPYTMRQLLGGEEKDSNKIMGVVIGLVTDIQDPDKLGRIKVRYPWLLADGQEDGTDGTWARMAIIGGGKDRGIYFSPEVDDEVLISFDHGDINRPFIVGALWNKKDTVPEGKFVSSNKKKIDQRIIRTRSGHTIILDDTDGKEKISIIDKTKKNSIVIDSKANSMKLVSEGDLTIDAGGKFIVNSKQDIVMNSKAKAEIEAKSELTLQGQTLTLQGQTAAALKAGASALDLKAAGAALKGTKVDIQANTMASLKGSAMVEIQGGMVKIN